MQNILIACDKFKGSMTAVEACEAIAKGIKRTDSSHQICICPMADGGEGMSEIITSACNGSFIDATVTGPLGQPVQARFGLINNHQTAVIEMAQASGLDKLPKNQPHEPWLATTAGTGDLIAKAIDLGVTELILGIGGSATNDGGVGLALALGYRFLSREGSEILDLPNQLESAVTILPPERPLPLKSVLVACDVTNPLLGVNGCTKVYGPQKGIQTSAEQKRHERRLEHLVNLVENGERVAKLPGSGAAGGLGFGSQVFVQAELRSGFDLIAQAVDLKDKIQAADLIITGEGKIDHQSEQGKVPYGVAGLATKMHKPTLAFCGLKEISDQTPFKQVIEIDRGQHPIEDAMSMAPKLLENTVAKSFEQGIRL